MSADIVEHRAGIEQAHSADDLEIGQVQWHCSEEGGGPDVGVLFRLTDTKYLWAGEISKDEWENGGPEIAELGDDFGWWLVLYDRKERTIIGHLEQYAARDLIDLLASMMVKP